MTNVQSRSIQPDQSKNGEIVVNVEQHKPICYIVTDIEADGPDPGKNSMLSLASVACRADGAFIGDFTANLLPLTFATADSQTMAWWKENPLAYEASTSNPREPAEVIRAWSDWALSLQVRPIFAAHPLSFDGGWVDWYLQNFLNRRLFDRPRSPGVCEGPGLDIGSLVMGVTGREFDECSLARYPTNWLGGVSHTHCALDDARGYAHLLAKMLSFQL